MDIILEGQKTGGFRKEMNPQSAAWQLITTGIGYAMIALNLSHFDFVPVEETIEFIMRGMK